jgi:hypothetical protein
MIRNLKALGLTLLAVFALAAVGAAAAQAESPADFWAEEGATKIDATGGTQTFKLPGILASFPLTCTHVTGDAAYSGETATLTGENIEYENCHVVIFGITYPVEVDTNGCHYTFNAGTYTSAGLGSADGDVTIEGCEENESITITVYETNGETTRCTFHVPEQTVGNVTYNNTETEGLMDVEAVVSGAEVETTVTDNNKLGCNEHETVTSEYNGGFIATGTNSKGDEKLDTTVTGTP